MLKMRGKCIDVISIDVVNFVNIVFSYSVIGSDIVEFKVFD